MSVIDMLDPAHKKEEHIEKAGSGPNSHNISFSDSFNLQMKEGKQTTKYYPKFLHKQVLPKNYDRKKYALVFLQDNQKQAESPALNEDLKELPSTANTIELGKCESQMQFMPKFVRGLRVLLSRLACALGNRWMN